MARLTIYDDGCTEGEVVRLRQDRTTIGRFGADILIPHDAGIANKHVSIERQWIDGEYRWVLQDLDSASGFWVRVRRTKLKDNAEFMVGRYKYVFREAAQRKECKSLLDSPASTDSLPEDSLFEIVKSTTRGYASVVRIEGDVSIDSPPPLFLVDKEYWIGRARECELSEPADFFMAPKHVRIFREDQQWFAETQGAPNGLWIRVERLVVQESCTFQIGEQRFHLSSRWSEAGS